MFQQISKLFIASVISVMAFSASAAVQVGEFQTPSGEIDHIGELASQDFDYAMQVYDSFVQMVIVDQASKPADLERLLNATWEFSEADGSNDHFFILVDLKNAFPAELEAAIVAWNVPAEQKQEVRDTLAAAGEVVW